MRLFGLEITRAKSLAAAVPSRGWYSLIREPRAGAWQRNEEIQAGTVMAHNAVYACVTLIAQDVGKLRHKLVEKTEDGIWQEVERESPFLGFLRKPNRYQNHIQFKEWWVQSKLMNGNAYALKVRDARGVVCEEYLLDPTMVKPLVAPNGAVYYQLTQDNLSGVPEEGRTVPASEIIHDRMNCLFHPLVGVSPIYACGAAATIGLNIEENAEGFFGNGSNPSGILTAPGTIDQPTAERLSSAWRENFSGENAGKVAVLGNDLKYQPLRMTAVDAQMIEHLRWTAETVCSAFHVPPFKIGIGQMPTYQNAEVLNQIYYSDCLQSHIEAYEAAQDEGLGLDGVKIGVELDLDALLRMDSSTQVKTLTEGVRGGLFAPNEARRKADLSPLAGGDTIYLQHQDYPMEKVFRRTDLDAQPASAPAQPTAPNSDDDGANAVAGFIDLRTRAFRMAA